MSIEERIQQAAGLLSESKYAVALTGAGISTPSGIPDFRSPNSGLWKNADPFESASIYAFRRRPQDFYDWIHPLARLIFEARPNAAHLALAQLEARGILKGIITQNVDMLHGRAGSTTVHEVHGHLREVTCMRCYSIYPAAGYLDKFVANGEVPYCEACGGVLKPNVILIGEQLPVSVVNQARRQIKSCDLMLIAGSLLAMAPAGDLPLLALEHGARIVVINFEPTHIDSAADVVIRGDVVDVIPEITTKLLDP